MGRPAYGGRITCESCTSIDVRCWHREGRLRPGQYFSWSWTRGGEQAVSIRVRTESGAVVLIYRSRSWGAIEQRVPITWTACHLGSQRPWFVCSQGFTRPRPRADSQPRSVRANEECLTWGRMGRPSQKLGNSSQAALLCAVHQSSVCRPS
jgi:hypothetical protein